ARRAGLGEDVDEVARSGDVVGEAAEKREVRAGARRRVDVDLRVVRDRTASALEGGRGAELEGGERRPAEDSRMDAGGDERGPLGGRQSALRTGAPIVARPGVPAAGFVLGDGE